MAEPKCQYAPAFSVDPFDDVQPGLPSTAESSPGGATATRLGTVMPFSDIRANMGGGATNDGPAWPDLVPFGKALAEASNHPSTWATRAGSRRWSSRWVI